MNIFYKAVFYLLLKTVVKCDIIVTDPAFRKLPPIFKIDDYKKCEEENKLYCKTSVVLQPINIGNKSTLWSAVEATVNHSSFYNHNELFHAICVDDFCQTKISKSNILDLKQIIEKCYNDNYHHLGFKCVLTDLNCKKIENQYTLRNLDVIVMLIVLAYILFVLIVTYKHYYKSKTENLKHTITPENKFLRAFSLIVNWNKLCSLNDRLDFQKLKFIQGIRFYNMMLIILCHTVCSYIGGYVKNTEYFELVYKSHIRNSMGTLFLFLVQTFFMLSAFLLSYHVYQTMEKHKGSKTKYLLLTFLNRYLRILPPLFVMIMLSTSIWLIQNFYGPIKDMYSDKEFERCQKNWWTNLLFINNHYHETEMCYFLTWYLAADTQLYLLSLLILSIIWTYRHRSKSILAICVLFGIFIQTLICYKNGYDIIYRLTPENSKNDHFRSLKFNAIYTSTFTNMATYMVGLCLGCWYFHIEKKKIWSKSYHYVGMFVFITVPAVVIYISSFEYSPGTTVLLSGVVKPCYALGIGIGILGMSQQKNSIFKKVCEWKPAIFLGNFTYSTYVVQYGIVFFRTAVATEPLYVSDSIIVLSFLKDAVISIFCGFLMHILVEMPALQLQKLYIPQARSIKQEKNSTKGD